MARRMNRERGGFRTPRHRMNIAPAHETPSVAPAPMNPLNPGGQHDWISSHFDPAKGVTRKTATGSGLDMPELQPDFNAGPQPARNRGRKAY